MGIFNKIGQAMGLASGDQFNVDPEAGNEYYKQALADLQGVGQSGKMPQVRSSLENQILSQLGQWDNNAAAKKQQFMQDMSRGFSNNVQNAARARGGTGGSMLQSMMPGSGDYEAQSRAQSGGLLSLNDQALQALGQLGGMQGGLYNQDLNRANALAGTRMGWAQGVRGSLAQNAENQWNAQEGSANRLGGIIGAGIGAAGAVGGGMAARPKPPGTP